MEDIDSILPWWIMGKINRLLLFSCLFCLLGFNVQGQDRYAVFFKFKPQNGLSLASPQDFLTEKALQRRSRENVAPDSLDLPVSSKYLDAVKENSDYILYASKWMNAAILVTDESRKAELEALPFVDRVELVARGFTPKPDARLKYLVRASVTLETCKEPKLNTREVAVESNSYDFQNQLIGIDKMHQEGFTGKGVAVAVFDAGFPGVKTATPFAHLFSNNRIIGQKDIVRPWNQEVFIDHQHGTNVLSLIAANEPTQLVSGAYESDYILVITEEVATEYRIEEFNWVRGAEYADSLGVDIINSSVGYWDFDDPSMNYSLADLDGKTTVITRGASIAADKGILVVNSVGNYGTRGTSSLVAPADAEGILAIGSVTNTNEVSGFSSRGPTADGRIKPDLAAFGQAPILVRSNGVVGAGQGTSFSAPQIAALAAGLWQAKPEWTKDELIQNLIRSATQSEEPDNNLGYGIPNFLDAYYGEILSTPEDELIEFKVYPNPLATEVLSIDFGVSASAVLDLVDLTGRRILNQTISRRNAQEPYQVDLQNLKHGMYVIRLTEGSLFRQIKLLKQ